MKNSFILIYLLISVSGCSGSKPELIETAYSNKSLEFNIDSLNIILTDELMHDYPYSSQYYDGKSHFFIGYNSSFHKLDIFNLSKRSYHYSLQLNHDGPSGVDSPWDFYIHNFDSIFYLTKRSNLILFNKSGKQVFNINLGRLEGKNVDEEIYGYKAHPIGFKLKYDKQYNRIFFNSYSLEHLPNKSEYYKTPFISFLDLESNKINTIPVVFPKIYLHTSSFLGEYFEPNVTFFQDLIIYSFAADPAIYTINLKNGQKMIYGGMSNKTSNSVSLLASKNYHEIEKRMVHLIENPYFYNIIPDIHRNIYYRLHSDGISFQKNESKFNSMSDKPEFLTVFDHEFKIIDEIELPLRMYNANSMFVTNEGLMIPFSHFQNPELDEKMLKFHIYKFKND